MGPKTHLNLRHPIKRALAKNTHFWAQGLVNHVPRHTNDEKVAQTTRFVHVLTIVLDGIQGELGCAALNAA